MKKKILFMLMIFTSLFLFACSHQEQKVEYDSSPVKKYMKTFDKDGTLLTNLSGYDISLDYRTEYSDHPIAYRKNKSIKRHLAHMSLLDDNYFYPFMWATFLVRLIVMMIEDLHIKESFYYQQLMGQQQKLIINQQFSIMKK